MLELGDISTVRCDATEYICEVDFKTKVRLAVYRCDITPAQILLSGEITIPQGWISGGYNAIAGHITGPANSNVGDISGFWSSSMEFKDAKTGKKDVLFDVNTVKAVEKTVLPESEQEKNESRRWVFDPNTSVHIGFR